MNNYLFLDIDGVLNSERSVAAFGKQTHCGRVKQDMVEGKIPEPMWDDIAVQLLRAAQEAIGFKIVISSTWRMLFSLQDFHSLFVQLYGWDTREIIVGKTGTEAATRGHQIKNWLDTHGKYPYQYCIIDDDSDMLDEQSECFVKTTFQNGLDYEAFLAIFKTFDVTYRQVGEIGYT